MKRFTHILFLLAFVTGSAFAVSSFELKNMNDGGTLYKSADHPTGVFVVEAYFLGCPYCNENAPNVDDLASSYASESRVQVLDVGIDQSDSQYEEWINRHHPNHPVLKDSQRKLIGQLGTSGYPSTYVIDCKGKVSYQTSGVWESDTKQEIQNAVDKILKAGECEAR